MQPHAKPRHLLRAALAALALALCATAARAQDTVTGAFEGVVRDRVTNAGIRGASVEVVNIDRGFVVPTKTDARGYFYSGVLSPGNYAIRVSSPAYQSVEIRPRALVIARPTPVIPRPVKLDKRSARSSPAATPDAVASRAAYTDALVVFMVPASTLTRAATQTPAASSAPQEQETLSAPEAVFRGSLLRGDARREGSFDTQAMQSLPLGGETLTRTFDELALQSPGVAPAPETIGGGTGPGVGAGVGTSGQFSANGLRSRANNFTVDGSDNNDEDIGVRRQGFFSLVPQPVESVQEYQVITLLAPAQFGRNLGAQVNAVSRSGGNRFHGTLFGLFNSSRLNARDFFDTTRGDATTRVFSGNQPVIAAPNVTFNFSTLNYEPVGGAPVTVRNGSGGRDSFTLGQGGFVAGGPLVPNKVFFFVSAEREVLNATKEQSFAVPTVAQRGAFSTGATGIVSNPFNGATTFAFPNTAGGNAVFSLFPFPNDPAGVYGENTFTQTLPASARGLILSGKLDANFKAGSLLHSLAGRYNFTDDWREIPTTGGALFSTLRPRVRTQNFSFFLNSRPARADSSLTLFNQLRLSYGRTRLRFEELCDRTFLVPSRLFPNEPCLLNAPLLENFTLPNFDVTKGMLVPNAGQVLYRRQAGATAESILGPLGQLNVAGFSPVGTDVFNFPQRRVNNTYQLADNLTVHRSAHTFIFGADTRRTELNSVLPRNFRPLLSFYGAPRLGADGGGGLVITNDFVRPSDLAAASAASGFQQTLTTGSDSGINLRFYQSNLFAQDEWRVRPNLTFSAGLRYEYNTPPREVRGRIEQTFDDPNVALVPGLETFVAGRKSIFEPDRNNFSPRLGLAYSPTLFGREGATVLRLGYGHYNDQILGAVVSQSRSVFPTYVTVNTAGGLANALFLTPCAAPPSPAPCPVPLSLLNPSLNPSLVMPGTLNTLAPPLSNVINQINLIASAGGVLPGASGVEFTLPARKLSTPGAHHYSLTLEQRIGADIIVSVAYVGTRGHNLPRFTTPNLGPNAVSLVGGFDVNLSLSDPAPPPFQEPLVPQFFGIAVAPGTRVGGLDFKGGRPFASLGGLQLFETTARSRYDAAQFEVRGRARDSLRYHLSYTFGRAFDDVSDVFDLAGASALPQDSLTFAGEYAVANYDVRKLLAFDAVYDFPRFGARPAQLLFGGLQLASTGRYRTGQPFTVNSIYDVNLDGNLTDRLDSTDGIVVTGDRLRPLISATSDPASLLAPAGEDGRVPRNSFRAGSVFELNLALAKLVRLTETQSLTLRAEVFNLTNRANFGVPIRLLEAPAFGRATRTLTPARRIQFYLGYSF